MALGDLHIGQGMVYKSISGLTPPQFLDTKSSLNFNFVCDISMIMCLRFLRSGRLMVKFIVLIICPRV
jgi:hypothetical protein